MCWEDAITRIPVQEKQGQSKKRRTKTEIGKCWIVRVQQRKTHEKLSRNRSKLTRNLVSRKSFKEFWPETQKKSPQILCRMLIKNSHLYSQTTIRQLKLTYKLAWYLKTSFECSLLKPCNLIGLNCNNLQVEFTCDSSDLSS